MTGDDRLQEGQILGRYRIVRLIGQGGMGAVYEAIHATLKKRVALKVLLPRAAERPESRRRFLREGEAASRIDHPHVVTVFDVGDEDGVPYLVMEYLEGRDLADFLAARGAMDVRETATLFLPVMAAVAAGHERGVVHRDLKPQNVFLARGRGGEPIPKVLDFGISKLIDDDGPPVTRSETVLGTASYMSPEQARGARHVDARSDQFTLGLILYEMLTGRRALQGENDLEVLYNAAVGGVPPVRTLRGDLPDAVQVLLDRMLSVTPTDRFTSVQEAGRVLLPFASEKTRDAVTADFAAPEAPAREDVAAVPVNATPVNAEVAAQMSETPRTLIAGAPQATPPPGEPGTVFEAVPEGAARRTLPLPTPEGVERADTTLRQAAIEKQAPATKPTRVPRPRAQVTGAAVAALLVLGVAAVWRASRSDGDAKTATIEEQAAAATAGTPSALAPRGQEKATHATAPGEAAPEIAAGPTPRREPEARAVLALAPREEPEARVVPFSIHATPPEAELVLDDRPAVRGSLQIVLPLAGSSHQLRVSAPGYVGKTIEFGANEPPPEAIHLQRVPAPSPRPAASAATRTKMRGAARRGTNDAMIIR